MLRRTVLAAMCAVIGFGGYHPASAQAVVDAKGKAVGVLNGSNGDGTDFLLRRVNSSTVVQVRVAKAGFIKAWPLSSYYFQSTDCSGAPYLAVPTGALVEMASFVPQNSDDTASVNGKLVYAGKPEVPLIVSSYYGVNDDPPKCSPMIPDTIQARPPVEIDVGSWRLIAPFKIK